MGYSEAFPFLVDGYLLQLNSQKPWSDLFSSFSFTSSANTVNSYPQINSESRPLSLPWLLTTPEQATVVSHQDTCGHLLSCLCASSLLFYGLLLTPHKSEQCHIALLLKTLCFPFHSQKLPCSSAPIQATAPSMPSLSPVLPTFPHYSSHSRQLPGFQACPRTFALTVSSAWNVLPPTPYLLAHSVQISPHQREAFSKNTA